jgi:hypothetical protein
VDVVISLEQRVEGIDDRMIDCRVPPHGQRDYSIAHVGAPASSWPRCPCWLRFS